MRVAVVKYNAGNIQSLIFALERLGVNPILTDDPETIKSVDKVTFPGQGEASSAMKYLRTKNLDKLLISLKQPFLGICLGLQLMCRHSEENDTDCLGIFDINVKRFKPDAINKVPHMGWNTIFDLRSPLFEGIPSDSYLYYVHSYYAEMNEHAIATTNYNVGFSAAIHDRNYYALQAHPEKSADVGLQIIKNFLSLK